MSRAFGYPGVLHALRHILYTSNYPPRFVPLYEIKSLLAADGFKATGDVTRRIRELRSYGFRVEKRRQSDGSFAYRAL